MPYCPRCGREQRCGCPKCHICGAELMEHDAPRVGSEQRARAVPTARVSGTGEVPGAGFDGISAAGGSEAVRSVRDVPVAIPALLLVFGCGILLVTLIEAVNNAFGFPGLGGAAGAADAFKRVAYYLGNLLYTSSVRGMIGFTFLGAGLLLERGGLLADREFSRIVRRAAGFLMVAVAALSLITALLLLLPIGTGTLLLTNLLPPLGAAVPILIVMGAAFTGGAWIMLASSRRRAAQ